MSPGVLAPPGVRQLPLVAWLVLLWMLLWGTWSWANLLSGLLVGGLVTWLLPLPPVLEHARFRPVAVLRLGAAFVRDLMVASVQVAWLTLRRGAPRSAVVAVALRSDSDLILTLITQTVNLVPGTLVLDVDREHRRLLVHVLVVRDDAEVERQRRDVLRVEERIVRALGSRPEIAALEGTADPPPHGPGAPA